MATCCLCCMQAAQLTYEDWFMADLDIPGVKIVGYEGVFGAIMTIGIMMPIAYYLPGPEGEGIHEDALDTLAMIRNSAALQAILAIDMAALLLYNVSGMAVTGHLGAVFRTVLETMRTLFVWLIDLLLFYTPLGMGQVRSGWQRHHHTPVSVVAPCRATLAGTAARAALPRHQPGVCTPRGIDTQACSGNFDSMTTIDLRGQLPEGLLLHAVCPCIIIV